MPNAKTCLRSIWLSENYDENEMDIFYDDLKNVLLSCMNDGFND